MRWCWMALGLAACDGSDPQACDQGTPTCESRLLVKLPDPRTDFTLHVTDSNGMAVDMDCPGESGGADFGSYHAQCGSGQLTIVSNVTLGDTVTIALEEGQPDQYTPTWSRGGDYCGNECDQGTIQL